MLDLIRKRYPAPAYALLEEVSNRTGSRDRSADALAFSLWQSNGIVLHGFEIKRSRQDLVRELDDPKKAEAVGKYCDYWWLVISDEKFLASVQIPTSWGVLAPRREVLHTIKKAPKRTRTPWTPLFIAALMRRFSEGAVPASHLTELKRKHQDEFLVKAQEIAQRDIENAQRERDYVKRELDRLEEKIQAFRMKAGIDPVNDWRGGDIAHAVRIVTDALALERFRGSVPHAHEDILRIAQNLTALAGRLAIAGEQLAMVEAIAPPTRCSLCGGTPTCICPGELGVP